MTASAFRVMDIVGVYRVLENALATELAKWVRNYDSSSAGSTGV